MCVTVVHGAAGEASGVHPGPNSEIFTIRDCAVSNLLDWCCAGTAWLSVLVDTFSAGAQASVSANSLLIGGL